MVKTILLVEDDPGTMQILTHLLKREGYNVMTAWNGQKARDIVLRSEIDLILTDIMMPSIDGLEFIQRLKEMEKDKIPPVVFMTAMSGAEFERLNIQATSLGAVLVNKIKLMDLGALNKLIRETLGLSS